MTTEQAATLNRISREHTGFAFAEMVSRANTGVDTIERIIVKYTDEIMAAAAPKKEKPAAPAPIIETPPVVKDVKEPIEEKAAVVKKDNPPKHNVKHPAKKK